MYAIGIVKEKEDEQKVTFEASVSVGDNEHTYEVELEKEYAENIIPDSTYEVIIKKAFLFLLDRESPEAIIKKFNIKDIEKYFPDFKKGIKKY